jgi:hypothetical protein
MFYVLFILNPSLCVPVKKDFFNSPRNVHDIMDLCPPLIYLRGGSRYLSGGRGLKTETETE